MENVVQAIGDPLEVPPPHRRRTDRSPHDRIDEIEDDLSQVRERLSRTEETTRTLGESINHLRGDVGEMRRSMEKSFHSLQSGILSVFSRLALAMLAVLLFAFVVVASIIGGSVYFDGLGIRGGTGPIPADVAPVN